MTFKEPIHKIVDQIKYEPYFQWLNRMGGNPSRRNQNLYCTYQRDKGHTTEQCRVLKDHLGKLVKAGHLKEFMLDSGDRGVGQDTQQRGNPLPPLVGVIEVIHAVPKRLISRKKERSVDCSTSGELLGRTATKEENEVCTGAYHFRR